MEKLNRFQGTKRKSSKEAASSPNIVFKHISSTEIEQDPQNLTTFHLIYHCVYRGSGPSNNLGYIWCVRHVAYGTSSYYYVIMQSDGNLVQNAGTPGGGHFAEWATNTPWQSGGPFFAYLLDDGTLILSHGTPSGRGVLVLYVRENMRVQRVHRLLKSGAASWGAGTPGSACAPYSAQCSGQPSDEESRPDLAGWGIDEEGEPAHRYPSSMLRVKAASTRERLPFPFLT